MSEKFEKGDYVLATKYSDGDSGDQWCVGFYHSELDYETHVRHQVVNGQGEQFRGNGFRRVKKINAEKGEFLVDNARIISMSGRSLWSWLKFGFKWAA